MRRKLNTTQIIEEIKNDGYFSENIVHWETFEPREALFAPYPIALDQRIKEALQGRGIANLYSHQAEAFELAYSGANFAAVTPTASGKTLCYQLPVLQSIIERPDSRALFLFPTKALAQDQKSAVNELIAEMGLDIKSYTYDGDTPANIRQVVRKAGHIVITNPDMLHSAILPHHTKWVAFFEQLRYIVIDETHIYRGVFGSHVANVIRRLKRICAFYGSYPQFICTSATIANPLELAQQLTGEHMQLIAKNGAPTGKKHFIFYNPPVTNVPLNIRKSPTLEARQIAELFLKNRIQTIVFARSRVRVEILLSYLQQLVEKELGSKSIRGYRGGYLPTLRREIEEGLRNGEIVGVVSTNALELGVDIGQLQVCVMTGYPGSIASTWQQAGRAGRRLAESVILMVAGSSPLDQYMIQHPDYFFNRNPESARINPDNLVILVDHIKCASYELPFKRGETFDGCEIEEVLEFLTEEQVLHEQRDKWHWMNDSFPAHNISLRSASQENVVIVDQTDIAHVYVLGEMDLFSAITLLHDEAIYLHEGIQYQVEKFDYEEKKAYVRQVDVDYYTDANLAVSLKVLEIDKSRQSGRSEIAFGDVTVNAMATIFKKIKFETHENIGSGPIHLPEQELHTNAAWLSFEKEHFNVSESELEQGLTGVSHILRHVAPIFVMCDSADLHVVPQIKAIHSEKPTIFLYDRYPGGIGLSEQLFKDMEYVLAEAKGVLTRCPCEDGCPSCVGVGGERSKEMALSLLRSLEEVRTIVTKE